MSTFAYTFDENVPLGSALANTADDTIRNDKAAIAERLALEHYFPGSSPAGGNSALADAAGRHIPGKVSAVALSGSAPSPVPPSGALWYDTTNSILYISNGTNWTTYSVQSPPSVVSDNYYFVGYATSYPSGGRALYTAIAEAGGLYSLSGVVTDTNPGFTFNVPVSGVYLITHTLNVIFAYVHTYARCAMNFIVYKNNDIFYYGPIFSQNHYGTSGTVGQMNGGSASFAMALPLSAGETWRIQPYISTNGVGGASVTISENFANIITYSLVRPLT